MNLTIYRTDAHDHVVAELDGTEIFSNDYCYENVLRVASHLGWKVNIVSLTRDDFEQRFA